LPLVSPLPECFCTPVTFLASPFGALPLSYLCHLFLFRKHQYPFGILSVVLAPEWPALFRGREEKGTGARGAPVPRGRT